MPLTPNGKLDRRALPELDVDSFVSQGYEAPQGEIESTLAAIWAELLKVGRVGRNDNFFMLGGHSLLAVKMTNRVHSMLGMGASLHALFEAPTIAGFASRIVQDGVDREGTFDVLLPLKPHGSRPPLFCVHPVFGFGWSYITLSKHLHPDQPLYALQARGIDGDAQLAISIEEMTLDYIAQIRRIQPQGPYHLLGWSFGGAIAQSMAVQLESLGEDVALLALMDSRAEYSTISVDIETTIGQDGNTYAEHLSRSGNKNTLEEGKALWGRARHVIKNNLELLIQYSPPVYAGDLVFFSATKSELVIDPSMWKPFTLGTIEVHEVDCEHFEMDKPEPMAEIGLVLAMRLEEL
ncbi:hypothetical protein BGX26_007083, partial [Mortierella sp. AD094]